MAKQDPYHILGVSKNATQEDIKNAYRELAKKYHPDLNPGSKSAEKKFKDVTAAYDAIGTPESRAHYDQGETEEAFSGAGRAQRERGPWYHQTQESDEGGRYTFSFGRGGADEDFFSSIFGFGPRRGFEEGHQARGEDRLFRMEIDLADATLGNTKELTLPNGKRLAVKIPQGISDGARLRFAGQGDPGRRGVPPGDAYIEIHVRPDSRFRQVGDDLEYDLPISISEAVLGGETRVPTLEGAVLLRIPRHSNTDKRLRLAGKGLFNREKKIRGDQYVILKVKLPEQIDAELEEALQKWQARHPYDPRRGKAA